MESEEINRFKVKNVRIYPGREFSAQDVGSGVD